MLPLVNIRRKRSKSKISMDMTENPFRRTLMNTGKVKSHSFTKQRSPMGHMCKNTSADSFVPAAKKSFYKTEITEESILKINNEDELESFLKVQFEKVKTGESEFSNELEAVESIYDKLSSTLSPYGNILKTLKDKIKETAIKTSQEDLSEKISKVVKENRSLLAKINHLSEINNKLMEEKEKLTESNEDFNRMFQENPSFIINYENIVSQMLNQCEVIKTQKKEIKRLKKIESCYEKLMKDLSDTSFFDTSLSDNELVRND